METFLVSNVSQVALTHIRRTYTNAAEYYGLVWDCCEVL